MVDSGGGVSLISCSSHPRISPMPPETASQGCIQGGVLQGRCMVESTQE